jgi:hypothetical protein
MDTRVDAADRGDSSPTFRSRGTSMATSSNLLSRTGRILALAAVVALAGCVSAPVATIEQPDLTALAAPYAARLQALGVSRIEIPGPGGAYVSVETPYGFFEFRYRNDLAPAPLVVIAGNNTAIVRADHYAPAELAQYRAAIAWVVPEALRLAPRNEANMRALQAGSGR